MNLGHKPLSPVLKKALAKLTGLDKHVEVIVHHYIDTPEGLQMEVEYRLPDPTQLGGKRIGFNRVQLLGDV